MEKKISKHDMQTEIHSDNDGHDHDEESGEENLLKSRWRLWLSLVILLGFVALTQLAKIEVSKPVEIALMTLAYLLAGYNTLERAFRSLRRGDFFNEFTHCTLPT